MSSGLQSHATIAEKVDVRKYWLVLRRRKWWGIIPFTLLALLFSVICLAVPPKYLSTCVIKASKSEVAEIYGTGRTSKIKTSRAVVSEEMLRYDRVMRALAGTEILREIEKKAEVDPELRGKLEEDLYNRVNKNTHIGSMGDVLIRVSYLGETPDRAFTVLGKLTNYFVENALAKERNNARRAREMAQKELTAATAELERKESDLASYVQEHPSVTRAGASTRQDEFGDVSKELEKLNRQITAQQHKLDRYREQLENMPERVIDEIKSPTNPEVTLLRTELTKARRRLASLLKMYKPAHPVVKTARDDVEATREELSRAEREKPQEEVTLKPNRVRDELESKRLELEAKIEYDLQTKSTLQLRKTKLEEELSALPSMQKEYTRKRRDREAAEERYDAGLKDFKRIDRDFHTKMEGLVSFSIIASARKPHAKDIRHIVRLAMMGLFVALAAGAGAIAGTEFLDQTFTDVESARSFLRLPSLGVIPVIETRGDKRSRLLRTIVTIVAIVALAAAVVLAAFYVDPVTQWAERLWAGIRDLCKNLA